MERSTIESNLHSECAMKVALLGSGKTGSKILEIEKSPVTVFNSKNTPTLETLREHDVVISFLPGAIFSEYIDMLIESGLPVVTGSTGFTWPKDLEEKLIAKKLKWIHAHNFSLGMNLIQRMIGELSKASALFDEYDFKIHEEHHTHKKDAPSGTALSWKAWLGDHVNQPEMTYIREGDIVGFHEMTLTTPDEEIKLAHTAHNRTIFARGALWAAEQLFNNSNFKPGLTHFSELVSHKLDELFK